MRNLWNTVTMEVGKVRIENAATLIGMGVDIMTGGRFNATEVGMEIDRKTKDVTIRINENGEGVK